MVYIPWEIRILTPLILKDNCLMKRFLFLCSLVIILISSTTAQPPKMVVLIVLDQFPYDYIERFQPYFGEHGFNFLIKNGANFTNGQYEYAYLKTGPGHASIATGANGHVHGISGNYWYDRKKQQVLPCVGDETVTLVGDSGAGRSPRNLKVTTMGDALRLTSGNRSKVIGISNKDRSAILMAGKTGVAYWIDDSLVVSSTYYMKSLPPYIDAFNNSGIFQRYYERVWTELKPATAAKICDVDDAPYESDDAGIGRTFPHSIIGKDSMRIDPSYYRALDSSPFSTEVLLQLGRTIVTAESLGTRDVTDMFCISISTTDNIGHAFGPNSHEVFDNVLRTDSLLATFFSFLEAKVGLANCIIALSSDHGIAPIPEYLRKVSPATDAGRITAGEITAIANRMLDNHFGHRSEQRWIAKVVDPDIYLNTAYIDSLSLPLDSVMHVLRDSLKVTHPFAAAYSRDQIARGRSLDSLGRKVALSYYPLRSGDIMFVLKPFYVNGSAPTNHGQPHGYDAHVVMMLEGKGIMPGVFAEAVSPIDIVPTLAYLLKIEFSKGREGAVLKEAVK